MVYASAQKNIGPAGLAVVIVREDLLDQAMDITPAVFNYGDQAKNESKVNTLPTYSIYITGLVFSWLLNRGGVSEAQRLNKDKAARLYALIDSSDIYRCKVANIDRSRVNICFHLPDESLERNFLDDAQERGLINLKGHGAAGGIRASVYNAMPSRGVDALIGFMQDFAARKS
jgi:phosphoserine aminotransferase